MQKICGVDVAKAWLDAWVAPGRFERFANTPEGVAALGQFCRAHDAGLVVMEASGGIERPAFLALWQEGQPCAIANPRAVRCFAGRWATLKRPIGSMPR